MIIRADARALPLRDACVQTCVTSPPYFGLRDYGTATWVGGDSACDHEAAKVPSSHRFDYAISEKQASNLGSAGMGKWRACPCGAHREDAQIGLEPTPDAYVASLVQVFREVRRALKADGTVWLNLGDSYAGGNTGNQTNVGQRYGKGREDNGHIFRKDQLAGVKAKDLLGIPWRVAFALQADGWYLRSDIIWSKPNPMPESVTDRPTKAHEYLFLLSKQERYYYDADSIKEAVSDAMLQQVEQGYDGLGLKDYEAAGVQNPSNVKARIIANARKSLHMEGTSRNDGDRWRMVDGGVAARGTRNRRSVWTVPTMPYSGAHFATFPEKLIEPCILAGCPLGGLVLDPFLGSGTVGAVAERLGRRWVGTDLSYQPLSKARTQQRGLRFDERTESTGAVDAVAGEVA